MLLGAAIYLFFVLTFNGDISPELYLNLLQWAILGWNVVLFVVTVLVIIDSVRKIRKGMTAQLASGVLVVKLTLIPFFLINFILLALFGLVGVALSMHGFGIPLLFVFAISVVLTYLAMVSTSIYGWASVIRLRREGRIGIAGAVIYTILFFIFVADILAGILVFARAGEARTFGRRAWLALVIALLESLVVLAIPGYAFRDLHLAWLSDIFLLLAIAAIVVTLLRLWVLRRRQGKTGDAEEDEPADVLVS